MRPILRVGAAAVCGRSHRTRGELCQDFALAERIPDRRVAWAALADGAGSCAHSGLGAACVTQTSPMIVLGAFDAFLSEPKEAGCRLIRTLQRNLSLVAETKGIAFRELASTLLFVCARRTPHATQFVAGHVGDGVIAIRENGRMRLLSEPDRGEFANTTTFVTNSQAEESLRVYTGRLIGNLGFILMSDGAADTLYAKHDRALADGCSRLLGAFDRLPQKRAVRILEKNVQILAESTRTGDDCSLAVLTVSGLQRTYSL